MKEAELRCNLAEELADLIRSADQRDSITNAIEALQKTILPIGSGQLQKFKKVVNILHCVVAAESGVSSALNVVNPLYGLLTSALTRWVTQKGKKCLIPLKAALEDLSSSIDLALYVDLADACGIDTDR